jgi:hypothetical protein
MASTGLDGPFPLTKDGVANAVTKVSPGAYALGHTDQGDGSFIIEYVGRSDDDLADRLQDHVPEPYKQFKAKYFPSAEEAFYKECRLYHDFPNSNNKVHPARTKGKIWSCPVCTIFD